MIVLNIGGDLLAREDRARGYQCLQQQSLEATAEGGCVVAERFEVSQSLPAVHFCLGIVSVSRATLVPPADDAAIVSRPMGGCMLVVGLRMTPGKRLLPSISSVA